MRVANVIKQRLARQLAPAALELIDDSARHEGHAGARPEGESHFRVTIVAELFAGVNRIERQRMVYAALGDLMQTEIHALSITALTPGAPPAMPVPAVARSAETSVSPVGSPPARRFTSARNRSNVRSSSSSSG